MPAFLTRVRSLVLGAVAALGVSAGAANAGIQDPGLTIFWSVYGTSNGTLQPIGIYNPGNGTWSYNDANVDLASGVTLTFNLNGDPDPQISGGLTVTNPALPVVSVILVITLPIAPALGGPTQMLGSAGAGLTAIGGGSMLQKLGIPVWQGMIDGSAVAGTELFSPAWAGLTVVGTGSTGESDNFGIPVPLAGPGVVTSIGIKIAFSLTQFDQASMTSLFRVVVPAPGVLALLGVGALGLRRRRR